MPEKSILVVDDEPFARQLMRRMLEPEGWSVDEAANAAEARAALAAKEPDVVLLDVLLGTDNGLDLLEAHRAAGGLVPVIVMTSLGEVETAVRAMKAGAYDFLVKPVPLQRLRTTLENAAEKRRLMDENRVLRRRLQEESLRGCLVGESAPMHALLTEMQRVVDSDVSVCLVGETGTGKELVARWLHAHGARAGGPFVALDPGSLAAPLVETELFGHEKGAFTGAVGRHRGKLEQADGGTLLLDDLGGMPLATQARFLRVLQERALVRVGGDERVPFDVRIVSATQRPLGEAVRDGRFREDLFFRLVVYPIRLPSLRERKEDLPLLVHHFLRRFRKEAGKPVEAITPEALVHLMAYDWPGNVRELENAVHRAVLSARGSFLTSAEFPGIAPAAPPLFMPRPLEGAGMEDVEVAQAAPLPSPLPRLEILVTLEDHERAAIGKALAATGGNVARAAERLKVPRSTLYRRVKALGLTS